MSAVDRSLKQWKHEIMEKLSAISHLRDLREVEIEYLGRKGKLTAALKNLKNLPIEDRRVIGKEVNVCKQEMERLIAETRDRLATHVSEEKSFDPTLPGILLPRGHLHPVTQCLQKIWEIFISMGYEVIEGSEIQTDYDNFQALNMPPDHPSRDLQDTFYLKPHPEFTKKSLGRLLLRTHTSAEQVKTMKHLTPPFRFIVTGKCYRRDDDMTHTPMFHQFEGIAVGQKITFENLKGTLHAAMREILEEEVQVRFRISYFPFVEPGAEFDVSCTICVGKGCSTCKRTGWLEMGGCGMIHPAVLKEAGMNPQQWQGFAFGFGVERPFMIKHRVPDLRAFYENDVRFLEQW